VITERTIATATGRFQALVATPATPAAPVAVFLHGFPDHPPTARPLLDRLAAAGYQVVAPWMRGYAPSTLAGPFDAMQLGRDAIALADALAGDRRVYLIGHDWGAIATYAACALDPSRFAAAVAMAVPHPRAFIGALVRTAQLARSWYMLAFQLPGAAWLAGARDHALIDRLWQTWSPDLRLAPADRAALHHCLAASQPAPVAYYRTLFAPRAIAAAIQHGPLGHAITVPTLQLQGDRDGCIAPAAARGQARYFTGPFRAEILAGLGHFMHVEDPAAIATAILPWLAAHPS
jgi:pimeloyl-ACP methyl ester carboxylesterase